MSWMSQIGALAATLIGFAKTSRTTQPTKASGSQTYALLVVGNLNESSLHGEITLKAPTLRAASLVPDLVFRNASTNPRPTPTRKPDGKIKWMTLPFNWLSPALAFSAPCSGP